MQKSVDRRNEHKNTVPARSHGLRHHIGKSGNGSQIEIDLGVDIALIQPIESLGTGPASIVDHNIRQAGFRYDPLCCGLQPVTVEQVEGVTRMEAIASHCFQRGIASDNPGAAFGKKMDQRASHTATCPGNQHRFPDKFACLLHAIPLLCGSFLQLFIPASVKVKM